jgi:hypothetical protein
MDEETFTLKSIIGGKTGPRIKELPKIFDPISHKRIRYVYLDISGMYCDLMLQYKYPYGRKRWTTKKETQDLVKSLNSNVPRYTENKLQ